MGPAIDGETTLATVSSSGLDGASVETLARDGGTVVAGRDENRLDATRDEPAAVGARDGVASGDPTDSGDGRTPGWDR